MEYFKALGVLIICILTLVIVNMMTSSDPAIYLLGCVAGLLEVSAIILVDYLFINLNYEKEIYFDPHD